MRATAVLAEFAATFEGFRGKFSLDYCVAAVVRQVERSESRRNP